MKRKLLIIWLPLVLVIPAVWLIMSRVDKDTEWARMAVDPETMDIEEPVYVPVPEDNEDDIERDTDTTIADTDWEPDFSEFQKYGIRPKEAMYYE